MMSRGSFTCGPGITSRGRGGSLAKTLPCVTGTGSPIATITPARMSISRGKMRKIGLSSFGEVLDAVLSLTNWAYSAVKSVLQIGRAFQDLRTSLQAEKMADEIIDDARESGMWNLMIQLNKDTNSLPTLAADNSLAGAAVKASFQEDGEIMGVLVSSAMDDFDPQI